MSGLAGLNGNTKLEMAHWLRTPDGMAVQETGRMFAFDNRIFKAFNGTLFVVSDAQVTDAEFATILNVDGSLKALAQARVKLRTQAAEAHDDWMRNEALARQKKRLELEETANVLRGMGQDALIPQRTAEGVASVEELMTPAQPVAPRSHHEQFEADPAVAQMLGAGDEDGVEGMEPVGPIPEPAPQAAAEQIGAALAEQIGSAIAPAMNRIAEAVAGQEDSLGEIRRMLEQQEERSRKAAPRRKKRAANRKPSEAPPEPAAD